MKKVKLNTKIFYLVIIVLFLAGVCIIGYPYLHNAIWEHNEVQRIDDFKSYVSNAITSADDDPQLTDKPVTEKILPDLYKALVVYNKTIYANLQYDFGEENAYAGSPIPLKNYGLSDDMIGYINVPRLELEVPVYLGASNHNMLLGAAVLGGSSMPVGGENTNCVIVAHRRYLKLKLFRDIQTMEVGDKVYITTFWETLEYEVVGTKIIFPDEYSEVMIQDGKDMVTLITCHPYGSKAQRYCVYCERVK